MKPKHPPQTKRRVHIPRLVALTKRTLQPRDLTPIATVLDRSPHSRPLEILEHASEQHVVTLLLHVDAPGPVAYVQRVPAEPARQELVALLAAEVPPAGGEVGSEGPGDLAAFPRREIAAAGSDLGGFGGFLWFVDGIFWRSGECVGVEIVVERPKRRRF